MAVRRSGAAASAAISAATRSGVKMVWSSRIAPPARSRKPALALLILIERVRQRHQDAGPADGAKLRHGRRAGSRDHQMARRHARRQVREERLDLRGHLQLGVGFAHARQILIARLLHDMQPLAQRLVEPLDRGRHDVGHDARALAAAEHQKMQRAAGVGRRIRPASPPGSPSAAPDCRCRSPSPQAPGSCRTRRRIRSRSRSRARARKRLARPITAFCSWISVGMPRSDAAITAGMLG